MRRRVLLLAGLTAVWPRILMAQSPDQAKEKADQSVRVGDRLFYRVRDVLIGESYDVVVEVTAVSDTEYDIVQHATHRRVEPRVAAFDHDWNLIHTEVDTFKPNNGHGIRLPLTVGKEWRTEYETDRLAAGAVLQGSVQSKVTSQESVTTIGGTFETFRIEHHTVWSYVNTTDPSDEREQEIVMWYAPQIDHWVRRTVINSVAKQIRAKESWELVGFLRKP